MYKAPDIGLFPEAQTQHAYFSARRADRVPSENSAKNGFRSSYLGSEVFYLLLIIRITPLIQTYSTFLSTLGVQAEICL